LVTPAILSPVGCLHSFVGWTPRSAADAVVGYSARAYSTRMMRNTVAMPSLRGGAEPALRARAVWGYGLAILCAGAALAVTESLRNPLFPTPLFFAAIVISTWYGGAVPGVISMMLATLSLDYYFIPPAGSLALNKPESPYLFEFALPALLTCWFVTKRRIAETTLRKAHDELQSRIEQRQAELARVSRMLTIGEMGVSIAHEVNQPLMAVVLNGDACLRWLGASPPNLEEARKAVGRMIDEGTRAGAIVRRIRALAKTSTERAAVDLNELAAEVEALLDRELARNRIVLRTELAKGLPTVRGDRVQLQQVIVNLAMNAIEAMSEEAQGRRELRIRSEMQGPDSVAIAVEDSGPGLPAGDPEELFIAFFTTKPNGVGIGLSISRTIVEAHGGRLWAVNSARGAVFQFRLPVLEGSA
jgi:signal transduction histidine kinase